MAACLTSPLTHLFGLASLLLLLIELILENIAIRLQFDEAIFVLAVQQVQFALELVFLLLEELRVE